MVVLSVEQYTTLMESVERELDVADRIAETDETRYTHSEVLIKSEEKSMENSEYQLSYLPLFQKI